MPPTVIFIRHAQALHNVHGEYQLHDPVLTPFGETQCADLQAHLRAHEPLAEQIDLIVTSPMRRTLQTTQLGLGWLIERGVPVVGLAEAQEFSAKPCDTGSPLAAVAPSFPFCDFSTVDPAWPSKEGAYAQTRAAIAARGLAVRRWLHARPERVVAVVSHSAILRISIVQRLFKNADYRVFEFAEAAEGEEGNEELLMVEEARTKGQGGMGLSSAAIGGERVSDFPDEW